MYRLTENYVHLLRAGYRGSIDFNSFSDLINRVSNSDRLGADFGSVSIALGKRPKIDPCMGAVPHGFPAFLSRASLLA